MFMWLTYFVVSGNAFFVGATLIVFASFWGMFNNRKRVKRLITYLFTFGLTLLLLSTTPLSIWYYVIGLAVGIIAVTFVIHKHKFHKILYAWALLWVLTGIAIELPYHFSPDIPGKFNTLYVIGDSLSQGIGHETKPWPSLLAEKHNVKVLNLAIAGATAESAMRQANEVKSERAIIFLEIGGNDLLGETPAPQFEEKLDSLLAKLAESRNRTLVMFELPLLPTKQKYGSIQRKLAKKYHVFLIPKRYLAQILCSPGKTVDGIHLSDAGHQCMAGMVWSLLGKSL